jgi:hypothetical protein
MLTRVMFSCVGIATDQLTIKAKARALGLDVSYIKHGLRNGLRLFQITSKAVIEARRFQNGELF